MLLTRRQSLALGASAFFNEILFANSRAIAAGKDTLTIAFNVNVPSFDPTSGPSAVNPTIQAIYRSIFDQYIGQKPDLVFQPGLLTAWGWNEDKTKLWMDVRSGVTWHDGTPFGPEDVIFSLERAARKDGGNPIQFIWATAANYKADGNRITAEVVRYEPTFFMWMAFLTGYVLPKAYYEKVGPEGFEKKPILRQRLPSSESEPELLGWKAGLRNRGLQIRT
jgi:peptide/nickel transport system substrate-binding protein